MDNNLLDENFSLEQDAPCFEDRVSDRIHNGYEFRFSEYISDGFRIFGQYAGGFIGYTVLYFLIAVGLSALTQQVSQFLSQLTSLLLNPFTAGYFIVASRIFRGEQVEFRHFFDFFSRYGQLLWAGVVSSILTVLATFILIIPGIYLAIAFSFISCFVVFGGVKAVDSLKLSQKIVHKNWWSFFGFLIVLALINVAGLIAIGIGVLVTYPASMAAIYVAYEDIIGTDQ